MSLCVVLLTYRVRSHKDFGLFLTVCLSVSYFKQIAHQHFCVVENFWPRPTGGGGPPCENVFLVSFDQHAEFVCLTVWAVVTSPTIGPLDPRPSGGMGRDGPSMEHAPFPHVLPCQAACLYGYM